MTTAVKNTKDVVLVRTIDAPREEVWKSWSEPERFMRWFAPKDFTAPFSRIDFRVGGRFLYCMRGPDGKDTWGTGVFKEIVPMERIVYSDNFADEKGNVVPASYYSMPGEWTGEMLVSVTFEEYEGKTKMTLQHQGLPEGEMIEMCGIGWSQMFDKLAASFAPGTGATTFRAEPGKYEVTFTRIFDAPRKLLFSAFTDRNLIPEWLGPKRLKTIMEKFEAKSGGTWRFINRDESGNEFGFHGVHHEILAPERIVRTFEFEGAPGHVSLESATFEEFEGKTKLTMKAVFQSVEDRDAMLKSGMEGGASESLDRLAELMEKLKRKG